MSKSRSKSSNAKRVRDLPCRLCHGQQHRLLSKSCSARIDGPPTEATYFKGRSCVLSNFYDCSIHVFGQWFTSSEQAYQYQKAVHFKQLQPNLACNILVCSDPVQCKKYTAGLQSDSWDMIKVQFMEEIARAKYKYVSEYRCALQQAHPLIVEAVPGDTFWSAGLLANQLMLCKPERWPGQNVMGKIHMKIRSEMASRSSIPSGSRQVRATSSTSGQPSVPPRQSSAKSVLPSSSRQTGATRTTSGQPTQKQSVTVKRSATGAIESAPTRSKMRKGNPTFLCPLDKLDICDQPVTVNIERHMARHHLPQFLLRSTGTSSEERCQKVSNFLDRLCSAAGLMSPLLLLNLFQSKTWPALTDVYPVHQSQRKLVEEYHTFLNDPLPLHRINLHIPNCVAALSYWVNIVIVVRTLAPEVARSLVEVHSSSCVPSARDVSPNSGLSNVARDASSVTSSLGTSNVNPASGQCMETPRTDSSKSVKKPIVPKSSSGETLSPHVASVIARALSKKPSTVSRPPTIIHQSSPSLNSVGPISKSSPTTNSSHQPPPSLTVSTPLSYAEVTKSTKASSFASLDFRYYHPDGTPRTTPLTEVSTVPAFVGSDSHFHLDILSKFEKTSKVDKMVGSLMPSEKLQYLVTSFCFLPFASDIALEQIAKDNRVKVCVGLHPKAVNDWVKNPQLLGTLRSHLSNYPSVVAVGEVGIDLTVKIPTLVQQKDFLRAVCRIALEKRLPVVIHAREADNSRGLPAQTACIQTMKLVLPPGWAVYKHCLRSFAEAKLWVAAFPNTVFGIGTCLLMKTQGGQYRRELTEAVRNIPLSHIVLESDAPFLHPEGRLPKGARRTNYPTCIFDVARRIANLKNQGYGEVLSQTRRNTASFYNLKN